MPARKTCPVCHRTWPEGKDPAEADEFMQLRMADLVKGLSPSSDSLEADLFYAETHEDNLYHAAERLLEIEQAEYLVTQALGRIQDAKSRLAATPVIMGAPAFIMRHGVKGSGDGLEDAYRLRVRDLTITLEDGKLRVGDAEDE